MKSGCSPFASLFRPALSLLLLINLTAAAEAAVKPPVPTNGTYIGGILLTGQTTPRQFNAATGQRHAIFMEFIQFPDVLDTNGAEYAKMTNFVSDCRISGALPALTLQCFGGLNSYSTLQVTAFANILSNFSCSMFLRWNHEMNGSWYPWGQQPALYIAKFREFANIVHSNAPGVAMLWTPNQGYGYPWPGQPYTISNNSPDFATLDTDHNGVLNEQDDMYGPYYPGDSYVDWVGHSYYHWGNNRGYNEVPYAGKWGFANGINNTNIPYFHNVFAVGHNKPMLIAETSALYDTADSRGGHASESDIKQTWIGQVYNLTNGAEPKINVAMPKLAAILWFSQYKYETEVTNYVDWRLDSNPQVAGFYRQQVATSYFVKAVLPYSEVDFVSVPTVVKSNGQYSILAHYATSTNRTIKLNLLDAAHGYVWYGGVVTNVAAVDTNITLFVAVTNNPAQGAGYIWDLMIYPLGGDYTNAIDRHRLGVQVLPDTANFFSAPTVIETNWTYAIQVDVSATSNRDIVLNLLDAAHGYAWFGGARISVTAGQSRVTMNVVMTNNPAPGTNFVWDMSLVPPGGDWTNAFDRKQMTVSVMADQLALAANPGPLWPQSTTNISFNYTAVPSVPGKKLYVNLLDPTNGWSVCGSGTADLPALTGTVVVALSIPGNPRAGSDLVLDCYIVHGTDDWTKATVKTQRTVVVTNESLAFTSWPAAVTNSQTYNVKLSYCCGASRYVQLNFLHPSENWAWYGGGSVLVGTGAGTATVPVQVSAAAPAGNDFVWDAYLAAQATNASNPTATARVMNVAVAFVQQLAVDAAADNQPISDWIYGINVATYAQTYFMDLCTPKLKDAKVTVVRYGATNVERYNYKKNRLFDVVTRNNTYPPMSWRSFVGWVTNDLAAAPFLQISVFGHVAGDGVSTSDTNYDYVQPTQDISDWVTQAGSAVKFWGIGNEPMISWKRKDFPPRYADAAHGDQVLNQNTSLNYYNNRFATLANAVKSANPAATVLGPTEANWWLYWLNDYSPYCPVKSPNAPAVTNDPGWHIMVDPTNNWNRAVFPDRGSDPAVVGWETDTNRVLCQFALRQKSGEQSYGKRLADYLDVHRYINCFNDRDAVQEARGYWDDTYQSWDNETGAMGTQTKLLKRLRNIVNTYYPGTELSFSEYDYFYWNGHPSIPQIGAVGEQDFLGSFADFGVKLACNWYIGEPNQSGSGYHHASDSARQAMFNERGEPNPKYWAFRLMSTYFHGTSVSAVAGDPSKFSVHAARNSNDLVIVAAYRGAYDGSGTFLYGQPAQTATVALANFSGATLKKVVRYGLNDPYLVELAPGCVALTNNTLTCAVEPLSIYAFILTTNGAPELPLTYQHVNPARLDFGPYETGISSNGTSVDYTMPILISNARATSTVWSVTVNASWLSVQGATNGAAKVTDLAYLAVNRSGLALGNYATTVTVATAEGTVKVPVTMSVIPGEAGGEKRICDFETGSLVHEWNVQEPYCFSWSEIHGGAEDQDAPYVYKIAMEPNEKPRNGDTASMKVTFNRRNGDTDTGRLYLPLVAGGFSSIAYDDNGNPIGTNNATGNWAGYDSFQIDIKTHTDDSASGKTRFLLTVADASGNTGKPDVGGAAYSDFIELNDDAWQTLTIALTNRFYDWRYPQAQNGSIVTMNFARITGLQIVPWQGSEDKSGTIYMDNIRLVKANAAGNRYPFAVVTQAVIRAQTGQNVPLFGDRSYDPDGTIASYRWTPATNLSNANIANPTFNTSTPGTYTYDLIVTDNKGLESRNAAQVVIRVIPALVGSQIYLYRDSDMTDRIGNVASNALDVYVKLVCSAGGSPTEPDIVLATISSSDVYTNDAYNNCNPISMQLLETAADSKVFTGHLRLAPFSRESYGEIGISEGKTGTIVVAGIQTNFVMGSQRYGWERMVDHFEDATNAFNYLEGVWFTYTDNATNNLSTCSNTLVSTGAYTGSAKSMRASGTLRRGTGPVDEVYAGLGTQLRPYYLSAQDPGAVLDLSSASGARGISFWLKGNGKMLDIVIGSLAITNYDNYVYRIDHTPSQWRKYLIPFTAFGQAGWSPVGVARETTLARANAVNFHFSSEISNEYDEVYIDDVSLLGGNVQYSVNPVYHMANTNTLEGVAPLLVNPGFDGPNATNWTRSGNATNENWGNWIMVLENWNSTTGQFYQTISNVVPGRTYAFTVAAQKGSNLVGQVRLELAWYNGTTLLSTDSTDVTAQITATAWNRVGTGNRTAPASATKVLARVTGTGSAPPYADNCCKFDDAVLTDGRYPDNDWVYNWVTNLSLSWDTNAAEGLKSARLHTTSTNWVGGMLLPPYDVTKKMTNFVTYAGFALKARRPDNYAATGKLVPRVRLGLGTSDTVNASTRWITVGASKWEDFLLFRTNDFYTAETVDNTNPLTRVAWTGDWRRITTTVVEYGPTLPQGTNTPTDILVDDFRPFGWAPPGPWKRLTVSVEYIGADHYDGNGIPVYYIGSTMKYQVILQNVGTLPYTNLTVRAIQEYHDTSTNVVKGQGMPGGSTNDWTAINVGAGAQVTLNDDYYIPSGTWPGYDQTHVIVKDAGLEIYDNDQAGIWCPPPQSLPPGGGGGSTNGMKGAGGGGLKRPEASFSLDSGQSLSATAYHLITVSTEPGLRYSIEFTDDLVPEPATWSPFASPEAGVWVESGDSPTTHTFVDDETAATSGSAPAAGHRYYRIKVDVP